MGVAVRGLHLEDALSQLENRDVVGSAAQVEDGDLLILLLVQAVGQRRGGGLVDDPLHVEAGDPSRVLRGLALRVVEIGRNRDDRFRHLLAQIGLRGLLHLLEDHRGDLGRRVGPVADSDHGHAVRARLDLVGDVLRLLGHFGELASHEALDGINGVLRIRDGLALRHLTDQPLPGLCEGHDGGSRTAALGVGDHVRLPAFHYRHARIRRAEVDADYLSHDPSMQRCGGAPCPSALGDLCFAATRMAPPSMA